MNDLISRQAVIDTLNVDAELLKRALDDTDIIGAERAEYAWGLGLIESCIFDVKELPSAKPERQRGKWIEVNDAYNRISGRCSVCGWEAHMYEDDVVGMDFCPNCGADMRKGEEKTE